MNSFLFRLFPALLLLWSTLGVAGQSTVSLTFTATFVAGTCDITVTPTLVDWGAVSSSDIRQAGADGVQPRDLSVSYSDCNGYGRRPKLKVTGTVLSAGIPLFSKTNGATSDHALGYGVRLVATGAPSTVLGNGDTVNVGIPGMLLSGLNNSDTSFQARLSCGNQCANVASLHGGKLNATVTFQFLYE